MLTFSQLKAIAAKGAPDSNIQSIVHALDYAPTALGLRLPHRYVHFGAQVAHESGGFRYDEEVWGKDGGTAAQKRYDIRKDLGNSPERDGDGFLYRGRTGMQATGKDNYRQFGVWCAAAGFPNVPDFVKYPDLINTDPWEGLFPVFFWTTRKLNQYADKNDIEMITRRINGGLNGFDDRIERFTDLSLVVLDFELSKDGIYQLQKVAQKAGYLPADTKEKTQLDGVAGPKTRAAMFELLVDRGEGVPSQAQGTAMPETAPSPVTAEVAVEVPVVVEKAERTLLQRFSGLTAIFAPIVAWFAEKFGNLDQNGVYVLLGIAVIGAIVIFLRGELIARRAKAILKELDSPNA